MERETYPYKMICGNCKKEITIAIPKGFAIREHFGIKDVICPECGCNVRTGRK